MLTRTEYDDNGYFTVVYTPSPVNGGGEVEDKAVL